MTPARRKGSYSDQVIQEKANKSLKVKHELSMTKNMKMKPRPGAKPINMTKLPGTAVRRHYNLEVNRRSGANSPVSTTSIKLNSIIK